MNPTSSELRIANRQRQREARLQRRERKCRCCGRVMRENIRSTSEIVVTREGHGYGAGTGELITYAPSGTFGAYGDGICTLRCGYRWAATKAGPMGAPPGIPQPHQAPPMRKP